VHKHPRHLPFPTFLPSAYLTFPTFSSSWALGQLLVWKRLIPGLDPFLPFPHQKGFSTRSNIGGCYLYQPNNRAHLPVFPMSSLHWAAFGWIAAYNTPPKLVCCFITARNGGTLAKKASALANL
jgi:hypothetical protein